MVISHAEVDGFNYPEPGSKVGTVYEVQLDGKRHPNACCALPDIPDKK